MSNRPVGFTRVNEFVGTTQEEVDNISSEDFVAGLVTDQSPLQLPNNALKNLVNGQYVKNILYRRNGLQVYSIAKPNSNKVMAIFTFFETSTGVNVLRFTQSGIHKSSGAGWVAYSGPALLGGLTDYFNFTVADNRAFFTNNGQNVIMEILPGTNTWAVLGNSPKARYLTTAFNRVIAAYIIGVTTTPYLVSWSGDLNYAQWDPLVDISAGSTPLVNSPADLSDDITGLFNLENTFAITRQRSIWLATNQPSATNPFFFYAAVPRIGCDVPRGIKVASDGLFFYNFQLSAAYFWTPGTQPQEISGQIKRTLKAAIDDPINVFTSFNYDTNSFTIFVNSNTSSITKAFTYNVIDKNWSYAEYLSVSTVYDSDFSGSSLTINQLVGTINALVGNINSLGALVANSNRFFGFNNGDLSTQPFFSGLDQDIANIVLTDNSAAFDYIADSKIFSLEFEDQYISKCKVGYTPYTTGAISLYYSKDDGKTWVLYKTITVDSTMLFKHQIVTGSKFIKTRKFTWRLRSTNCMFSHSDFHIQMMREINQQGPISRR